jgi:hypothetical protein
VKIRGVLLPPGGKCHWHGDVRKRGRKEREDEKRREEAKRYRVVLVGLGYEAFSENSEDGRRSRRRAAAGHRWQ